MLLEALLALTTVLPRIDDGIDAARARTSAFVRSIEPPQRTPALPYFSATARAVSNWRDEAGGSLVPTSLALVAKYSSSDPAFVARCVKLNNYWCIKQARWSGELGGDAEGHTGFGAAADGADAAAQLLRRYYRDYNRKTALAIVRRWAPAECGLAPPLATAKTAPKRSVSADIAPRGIAGTVRARFLARHGRGGAPRRVMSTSVMRGGGLRVQPWSALARMSGHPHTAFRKAPVLPPLTPVADIATGLGSTSPPSSTGGFARRSVVAAKPVSTPTVYRGAALQSRNAAWDPAALLSADRLVAESAALPSLVAGLPPGSLLDLRVPPPFCGNDETRIANYASRIAASVGLKPDDDLGLFDADGAPTERLSHVMLAMSSVELGSLRARPELIAGAIARLSARTARGATSAALN